VAANPEAGEALLPVKHPTLLLIGVIGSTTIQFLDATIANVALPHMQSTLGASFDTVSWVLTSYIIATVVMMPLTGWLSDRVGSRNLYLISVGGFILTSMLCGVAQNLGQMVAFRILQGCCAAFIGPLSQTIMYDTNPPEKQARAMAIWGFVVILAPIAGPLLGGYLTETLNWRWVFYVNLPIGVPAFALLWWLLPSRPVVRRRLDYLGYGALAIGLAIAQLMMDRGQHKDWFDSWEIIVEAIVAASALWIFVVQMATAKDPLIDRGLLRNSNFLAGVALQVMLGFMLVGMSALLPPMMQNLYGYSVTMTGLLLAPRGLGTLATMLITTRLNNKVDLRIFLFIGFFCIALSLYQMTFWTLDMGWEYFVINGFIQGIGIGLTFMPINMMSFSTLEPRLRPDGAGLLGLARSFGGSFGISLIVVVLARNIQVSHSDLAGAVTSFNLPALDPSSLDRFGAYGAAAMMMLDGEINRQAAMIAYLDDFKMMMIITLCFLPLIFMLKPPKAGLVDAKDVVMAE
jgi:MFS transporter, DHA2 family, multidrug resistance protein